MAVPLRYCARSLVGRGTTTIATAAGIALVVFVLAASQMLSTGMRSTLVRSGSEVRALVMQRDAYSEDDSRIRQAALTTVAGAPGVARAADGSPLVSGEAVVQILAAHADDASRITTVQVRGVGENVFSMRPEVHIVGGRAAAFASDEAIIGKAIEGSYDGLVLGGQLMLKKGRDVRIVGIFDAGGAAYESEVWMGLDVVRSSLGWDGYLSTVVARVESKSAFDGFAAVLDEREALGLSVIRERAYYERVSEGLAGSIEALGDLVTLIFACGAVLGAAITMNEATARRRREIGVLIALGFTGPEVMLAFMLESMMVALVGGMIGVALASVLSFWKLSTMNYGTGNEIAFPFELSAAGLLLSLAIGTGVGLVGGFVPALRASRIPPATAMRH